MKKIILFIFAVMMISTPALAGDTYLKINPSCTNADGQVSVDVIISGNDICSGTIHIAYDTEALKPVSVSKSNILENRTVTENLHSGKLADKKIDGYPNGIPDVISLSWLGLKPIENGVLYTIKFNVLADKPLKSTISCPISTIVDSDEKKIAHEAIPGKVYLNGLFADTEYSENGTTAAITANIYNGEKTAADADVYVARYAANDSLIDVVKHTCKTESGEILSNTYSADIGGNVSYVKVFCWRNGVQPINP